MILYKDGVPCDSCPLDASDVSAFSFESEGQVIVNPCVERDGVTPCLPSYYGFTEWGAGGNCLAYRLDLPSGGYLLVTCDGVYLPDIEDIKDTPEMVEIGAYDANGENVALATLSEFTQKQED